MLSYWRQWKRVQEMLLLFTHIIFEVGAGAAQQKDAGALGMAVLAGQVQSRVPCLGERRTEGAHVSNTPRRPGTLAGGQDSQESHCLHSPPSARWTPSGCFRGEHVTGNPSQQRGHVGHKTSVPSPGSAAYCLQATGECS